MMATKARKLIKTKAERTLSDKLDFRGKYLDSLLAKAAQNLKLESPLPDAASYLREIDRRLAESVKTKWGINLSEYRKLRAKAEQILRNFSTGYSMGERKRLIIGEYTLCEIDNTREYANSSRYKATHGDLRINLTLQQLRQIELIEGVWTQRLKGNQAWWLQSSGQKHKHAVKWVKGFLVGASHGATLEECRALESKKAIRTDEGEIKRLDRFVGLQDRVTAGACEAGVLAFCQRHNLDPSMGYRMDYLLQLDDPTAKPYIGILARRLKRSRA